MEFFSKKKISLGEAGEDLACQWLKSHGFTVIARNYQNQSGRRLGEIDIIARDRGSQELVFVEVKTRNFHYLNTLPEENITYTKLRRLARIAEDYLRHHPRENAAYRFDAIAIWLDPMSQKHEIRHLPSIFL